MTKPVFEIDGNAFDDIDGFYREFTRKVIPDTQWGHNLDALDDVLWGGMGTPDEGFVLEWVASWRSRQLLSQAPYKHHDVPVWDILMDIFASHPEVEVRFL